LPKVANGRARQRKPKNGKARVRYRAFLIWILRQQGVAAGALRGYQDPPRGSLQLTLLRFIKCRLGIPITQYFGKFASVSAVHVRHQIMPNTIAARNTNDIIVASTFNLVLISIVAS
jgi:hypothetical protein